MYSIIMFMLGWKLCSKFDFISYFLILADFAAFLDHTKENADVSNICGKFQVTFYIFEKYIPGDIKRPNLVALPIISQELGMGGYFAPHPKQGSSDSPTTIGLTEMFS